MASTDKQQPPVKGIKKCRISRNKKHYWKKGTNVQDAEDFLHEKQIDEKEGGLLWERKDEDLFKIDREPASNTEKLTRRQMAALMKRMKKQEPVEQPETGSKRLTKRTFPKKLEKQLERKAERSKTAEVRKPYDLWGQKPDSQKEISVAEEYYFRVTKKKLPREPKTLKHTTSILPHVEVDEAGASYNPPVSKYLGYVAELAKEEARRMKEIEKIERQVALSPGERFVTQKELEAELRSGLDENGEIQNTENEPDENDTEKLGTKPASKPKTMKARRLERMERRRKLAKNVAKFQKEQMHLLYSVRKLSKEVSDETRKRQELAAQRRKRKMLKRLADTQRLGRGKFEPPEKPVLLMEELPGSLREVRPQGSIISERLKSLQKRNMLPVLGEKRHRRKLKRRLRFKIRENRKHQEVRPGTVVI